MQWSSSLCLCPPLPEPWPEYGPGLAWLAREASPLFLETPCTTGSRLSSPSSLHWVTPLRCKYQPVTTLGPALLVWGLAAWCGCGPISWPAGGCSAQPCPACGERGASWEQETPVAGSRYLLRPRALGLLGPVNSNLCS